MKVLVIEGDRQVAKDVGFSLGLRYPEVTVVTVAQGIKGIDMVEAESPDLVIADASLPDMDTLDLVSKIREFSDVPLVILYRANNDMDRAQGFEAGVDDYITQPFSPVEFLARVKALLRRTQGLGFKPERTLSIGQLSMNFATHEVFLSDKQVKLTPIEYKLLAELVRNVGRVVDHETLLKRVWGSEYTGEASFVKKYIYRLRAKLETDGSKPEMILTERGTGYRFVRPA